MRKKRQTTITAGVIGAMVLIAGGIITTVLIVDARKSRAGAAQAATDQSTAGSQTDAAPLETPPPPQQAATADDRSSDEEVVNTESAENLQSDIVEMLRVWQVPDNPSAEQSAETEAQALRSATRGLIAVLTYTEWPDPEFGIELRAPDPPLVCTQISGADRILRTRGWRLGNFYRLDEWDLPGEYTLEYSRSVGGTRLAARLIGDDSRVVMIAMNGLVGQISSPAEHSEAKRKAWEFCITTAKALLPNIEPTVAESRAVAEDKGMRTEGEAVSSSGWRVITKDYEDEYMLRPRSEGDWLLMLHISRD